MSTHTFQPSESIYSVEGESMLSVAPCHTVEFHDAKGQLIGTFDFSQSPATFTGDVDASAKLFVELVIATFNKAVPQ